MRRWWIIPLVIVAIVGAVSARSATPTGSQYAECAGHYFAAGAISAVNEDEEGKIYYTLLSLMAANESYETLGFPQARGISDGVVQKYTTLMAQDKDFIRPLIINIGRCDKLFARK